MADQLFAKAQQIPAGDPADSGVISTGTSLDTQTTPSVSDAEVAPVTQAPKATLTTGMRSEIARGDSRFYHVHLNDSCWNDGDIVEILLNGQPMFLVPINNAGVTLSIPVSTGTATVISIRGVYDGGGGITVACRTSQGEGFVRVMAPGEIQPLGVVLP